MSSLRNLIDGIASRTTGLAVPKPKNGAVRIGLGLVNFFLFGVGTVVGMLACNCILLRFGNALVVRGSGYHAMSCPSCSRELGKLPHAHAYA